MARVIMITLVGLVWIGSYAGCSSGSTQRKTGHVRANVGASAGGEEQYYEQRFSKGDAYEPYLAEYYNGK